MDHRMVKTTQSFISLFLLKLHHNVTDRWIDRQSRVRYNYYCRQQRWLHIKN